jgi:hypothetical protein
MDYGLGWSRSTFRHGHFRASDQLPLRCFAATKYKNNIILQGDILLLREPTLQGSKRGVKYKQGETEGGEGIG